MDNSVAAETRVSTSIVHFYCTFRTQMSEWSGDGGPYLSEYDGEILVGLENDVDEFRLAGRARLFIVNPDAAEDDEEAPSLFELLDLRGETAPTCHCCTRLSPTCSRQRYVGFLERKSYLRETYSFWIDWRFSQNSVANGLACGIFEPPSNGSGRGVESRRLNRSHCSSRGHSTIRIWSGAPA
jgi:hypothetical protein